MDVAEKETGDWVADCWSCTREGDLNGFVYHKKDEEDDSCDLHEKKGSPNGCNQL